MTREARADAKGNAFESRGRYFARPSLGGGKRKAVLLPTCTAPDEADKRAAFIAEIVNQVRRAGKSDIVDLEKIVREAANASDVQSLADIREIVNEICGGQALPSAKHVTGAASTFKAIGEDWTSGKLAKAYPDYIRAKRTAETDEYRLEKLYETIGDVPIASFTLDHAERAMRALPDALSPASRRHYAQLIARILGMACYPLRLIKASPLPRGWLPKIGPKKGKFYLYPAEDAKLLAHRDVPLVRRVLEGFLAREGMRRSEAAELQWSDISDVGEVTLDQNKTDDPRAWALDPGVRRALKLWRKIQKASGVSPYVFSWKSERVNVDHLAEQLRDDLEAAGVERASLFKNQSAKRLRLRAHDLRGTFVTLSLANGKTETWVMDRTGHKSSGMVNEYRQAARSVQELELGTLKPLDEAIPELADLAAVEKLAGSKPDKEREIAMSDEAENVSDSPMVRKRGVEPLRELPHWNLKPDVGAPGGSEERGNGQITEEPRGTTKPPATSAAASLPGSVDIELTLARALDAATTAGRWDVVAQLAKELEARRLAASGNVVPIVGKRERERQ